MVGDDRVLEVGCLLVVGISGGGSKLICKISLIINSNRDGEVFLNDGLMYLFDAFSSDGFKRFWRCSYKRKCKARVHTGVTDLIILKHINNHTHDSDAAKVEANIAVCIIKKRVRETMEPTSTITLKSKIASKTQSIAGLSIIIFEALQKSNSILSTIHWPVRSFLRFSRSLICFYALYLINVIKSVVILYLLSKYRITMLCLVCNDEIYDGDEIKCKNGKDYLHFSCASFRETALRKLTHEAKLKFSCSKCKVNVGLNSNTKSKNENLFVGSNETVGFD
ncbi:hypothetical protein AGLY_015811 [Aphis glycines]|uniref:FLYWCH-type domain-containing protein n=1 Tax=Aphis glycines TaxID=307491 RepID=A0A6G0T1F2_APHGL|nr:hypothetical protein AGLY_015811 [Aphis glycines]